MNVFITGTDTEIGKTTLTCGLLSALAKRGRTVAGMKPVAAGTVGGRNSDAVELHRYSSQGLQHDWINPCVLQAPTAPSIAAVLEGRAVTWEVIANAYDLLRHRVELVVVEGVGGWRVPLAEGLMASDIPKRLSLPVILVAGIRLGAINHTLLTVEAIQRDGCVLLGWIANTVDPTYPFAQATIDVLKRQIPVPCLSEIPWFEEASAAEIADRLTVAAAAIDEPMSS
jgi:dethiobiotin synthetase